MLRVTDLRQILNTASYIPYALNTSTLSSAASDCNASLQLVLSRGILVFDQYRNFIPQFYYHSYPNKSFQ